MICVLVKKLCVSKTSFEFHFRTQTPVEFLPEAVANRFQEVYFIDIFNMSHWEMNFHVCRFFSVRVEAFFAEGSPT